jgi:hypothetical protein
MKNKKPPKITYTDLEEITRLIKKGFTSGRLDGETEDGNIRCIRWEFSAEVIENIN